MFVQHFAELAQGSLLVLGGATCLILTVAIWMGFHALRVHGKEKRERSELMGPSVMPPTPTAEIVDLTIDVSRLDVADLLQHWTWRVPATMRPVQMNKFGDWVFLDADGSVHLLDLIEGELTRLASSLAQYNEEKNRPERQSEWFLDGFVFQCHRKGLRLKDGECYGWRIHPMIGGKFEFANIQIYGLRVYQELMGQLLRQWRQLKPGEPIPKIEIEKN